VLLRRWARGQNSSNPLGITALNTLCFSAPYCTPALWAYVVAETTNSSSSSVEKWCQQPTFGGNSLRYIQTAGDAPQLAAVALLCLLLSHVLVTVDDDELYSSSISSTSSSSTSVSAVLPLHELRRAVRACKHLLYRGRFSDAPLPGRIRSTSSSLQQQQQQEYDNASSSSSSSRRASFSKQDSYSKGDAPQQTSTLTDFSGFLLGTLERVLSRLHSRAARRPFGAPVISASSENSSSRFADGSTVNSEDVGDALWLVPDAASKRVLGEVSVTVTVTLLSSVESKCYYSMYNDSVDDSLLAASDISCSTLMLPRVCINTSNCLVSYSAIITTIDIV
jgi:hypothetical protein